MASLERDAVESSLKKKGFVVEERDHRYFMLYADGQYTGIHTKTSRGTGYKTLGSNLVGKMAEQLKLTTQQFVELVRCPLSAAEYIALLNQKNEL